MKKEEGKLEQSLNARQMSMITLGGVIGAGLFIGSGTGIHQVGPGIIISYIISGVLIVLIMRILGEMAIANPTSGSFSEYAREAIGPWAGITAGWLYWFYWVVIVAIEAIAGAAIINSWFPELPIWFLTLALTLLMNLTNIYSVKFYGVFEYWFAMIKVTTIIIFLILGVLFIFGLTGGSPVGTSNLLHQGGFFPNGFGSIFLGVIAVFFSFTGPEIATIAAAESKDPVKSIRKGINGTVWRVLLFFIGSIIVVVTLLPWDSARVLQSPFVAVLDQHGVPFAADIMNFVVLTAVLSCLNSGLYTTSRMMYSLAQNGDAPKFFLKLSKKGTPARAVFASTFLSYFAVITNFISPEGVFLFLVNSSSAIVLLVYLIICFSQLRMRKKLEIENPTALKMKMWLYPYLTYATIIGIITILVSMGIIESTQSQLYSSLILACIVVVASYLYSKNKMSPPPIDKNGDKNYSGKEEIKY